MVDQQDGPGSCRGGFVRLAHGMAPFMVSGAARDSIALQLHLTKRCRTRSEEVPIPCSPLSESLLLQD